MKALLTSCGRPDLLHRTLESFYKGQQVDVEIIVHEDSKDGISELDAYSLLSNFPKVKLVVTGGIGQHKSIEKFLKENDDKYYIHLEDDFCFENTYDWISESVNIMEHDNRIVKVLSCKTTPHPCDHNYKLNSVQYGYINPWTSTDGIVWSGFSHNPGVTRMDSLKNFMPFPKFEQDLAERILKAGYKVVELKDKVYRHIGDGRSTVHLDPTKL